MTEETAYIAAADYCAFYKIDIEFFQQLNIQGLLTIRDINGISYLHPDEMADVEKFKNLYYELDINVAGIEAIQHLLNRIQALQGEIVHLQNRITSYRNEQPGMTGNVPS